MRKGTHHSKESKRKIRENHKGFQGKYHSLETIRKISKSRRGGPSSYGMLGKHHSEKTKRKARKFHEGFTPSEEVIEKMSRSAKKRWENPKERERASKTMKKLWQNPEYRERQLKTVFARYGIKPTKPERRLRNRLNHLFPNEYKYVGNGSTFIGGKCPDFININGQKKIIEMFGDFWHSEEFTGRTKYQEENQRIKYFVKYGYSTLIVWQCELKDIKQLKKKLKKFHNS